jgi:tetratricopeptide (TPR) repeat protein
MCRVTPERWPQARALFDAVIELSPSDADAYLREACAADDELLAEVRRMLEEGQPGGALDHPPWEVALGSTAPPPVFSAGQVVAGRYRIVRYLSRGGMGEVYEAEHPLLPDRVALKTLLPAIASDEAMIANFKQEIRLARKIAHPNVCKVFDLEWHQADGASQDTILFLTMEFLQGETLSSRIRRQGRVSSAEALPLLEQMAEALEAAHRAGVIHRDFKPSNVMLVPSSRGVRVVVTDFGLARANRTDSQSTATLSNNVAGTLDYMAPELLTGSVATFRSDIYALGMVAYQMVTGELPFTGEAALAAAFLRARKPVPSPRKLAPDLDSKWEGAILRALDPDPGRRFSEVREFPLALRGEKVTAAAASPSMTRRRVLVAACAVAALAAGWTGWRSWSRLRVQPAPEAARVYQQGVDDIEAGAYFAATKALEQAVQLAPDFSPARARLAESWYELDLPEKALLEFLPIRRRDNSSLPKLDQLQIEAVDLTITHESAAAVAKYEEMLRRAGRDSAGVNVDLGRAYEAAGEPDNAIDAYRRAAEGPSHSPAAWLRLGVLYSRRKKLPESEAAFAAADLRYQQSSNLEGLTELTLQRGVVANRAHRYSEAAALLRKAMEYARQTGNQQQEISARLTLANASYAAGDNDLAQTLAREALATAQANQMESLTIRGLIDLGSAYRAKGDLPGAEQHFQDALTLAVRSGSPRLAAQSQLNLASLDDVLSRTEDQIREAQLALAYFQPNHWVQETFQSLLLIGRGEQYRGHYAAALDSFQHLLDQSIKAGDQANIAQAQESLGDVYFFTENYPRALEHYQASLAANGGARLTGYAARDCAITLARLGRYAEALAEFARADAAAANNLLLRSSLVCYRAEMALSRNQFREAIDAAKVTLAGRDLDPSVAADLTRILGLALLRSTDRRAGLRKCEEAAAAARKLDDSGESLESNLALLEAWIAAGDSGRARNVFHDLQPDLAAHPESRWRTFALMARSDRQYAAAANEALGQLDTLWGHDAFLQYRKRPDIQDLSRPLSPATSARQ